jgi:hypothetical protein
MNARRHPLHNRKLVERVADIIDRLGFQVFQILTRKEEDDLATCQTADPYEVSYKGATNVDGRNANGPSQRLLANDPSPADGG